MDCLSVEELSTLFGNFVKNKNMKLEFQPPGWSSQMITIEDESKNKFLIEISKLEKE
jgi:hypothetical protein